MAVWEDWLKGKGKGDLRQLLRDQMLDPAAVRAEIRAVRKAGLDPDLPPPALHHLAMYSSLWGFSTAEAREYAEEALATEDMSTLHKLLGRNRAFLARTRHEFSRAVEAAFRPAPVPSIDVLPPVQEMPDRDAAARSAAHPPGRGAARADVGAVGS